jgi:lipopolysaccharide export system protein LptA
MKRFSILVLALCLFFAQAVPLTAEELRLTSEKMRYDSETGNFWADENVKVTRGTISATSKRAEGNMNSKTFTMLDSVHVFGTWMNEPIDMKGNVLSGQFGDIRAYFMEGAVKGSWGARDVDTDRMEMTGDKFAARSLRRYADKVEGYVLSCNTLDGMIENGAIASFTALGNVHVVFTPKDGGNPTDLKGDKAVYSRSKGQLVVTGNVTALQKGRSLKANNLIYHTVQNTVEATGKPQLVFTMDEKKQQEKK